jgi:hypothetical protein
LADETHDRAETVKKSEWLRDYLQKNTGEDCYFNAILGRSSIESVEPGSIFEKDRLQLFEGIVASLEELLGDGEEAANWLFRNSLFESSGKDSPFRYLADGEFDVLWFLHDLLRIIVLERSGEQPGLVLFPR